MAQFTHKVFGIDQSLTGTGLAVIDKDGSHSTTLIKPTMVGVERLLYIETALERWIAAGGDLAVMEGYAMGAYAGHTFGLGECGAIIKRTVFLKKIRLISVAPGTLKKYVTGHGIAPKNVMLLEAYKKFGISFHDDDSCDAYCLARLGLEFLDVEGGAECTKEFKAVYKAVVKYNITLNGGDPDE